MRNPDRIEEVLAVVKQEWKESPDLRLGQLISNASGRDVFSIEDDELVEALGGELEEDMYVSMD